MKFFYISINSVHILIQIKIHRTKEYQINFVPHLVR